MKLSAKQVKKLTEQLEPLHTKKCFVCGNDVYNFGNTIFELKPFNPNVWTSGSAGAFPVIPIICSKCGYTHFVNAIAAGIVDAQSGEFTPEWSKLNE